MAQLFHPAFNSISRGTIFGGGIVLALAVWVSGLLYRSPYVTEATVTRDQPVPFSHEHHVGGLGIDCRYCHTSVEEGPAAGIPPSRICMKCHSQVWADAPMLEPVRRSARDGMPIEWTRVHRLPDYVYFDHSIHVAKGVGCVRCHGDVGTMPLMSQQATLYMEWCLDCHRHPERAVGPPDRVFDRVSTPAAAPDVRWRELLDVRKRTDCVDCHR